MLLDGCVTIKNVTPCSADGLVSDGGICTNTLNTATAVLTPQEYIDFLEAQPERTCVPVPGFNVCADIQAGTAVTLPARGAAISLSADDYNELATELEQACRELGSSCSLQTQQSIAKMRARR